MKQKQKGERNKEGRERKNKTHLCPCVTVNDTMTTVKLRALLTSPLDESER
jgi:hypothetical protein